MEALHNEIHAESEHGPQPQEVRAQLAPLSGVDR